MPHFVCAQRAFRVLLHFQVNNRSWQRRRHKCDKPRPAPKPTPKPTVAPKPVRRGGGERQDASRPRPDAGARAADSEDDFHRAYRAACHQVAPPVRRYPAASQSLDDVHVGGGGGGDRPAVPPRRWPPAPARRQAASDDGDDAAFACVDRQFDQVRRTVADLQCRHSLNSLLDRTAVEVRGHSLDVNCGKIYCFVAHYQLTINAI